MHKNDLIRCEIEYNEKFNLLISLVPFIPYSEILEFKSAAHVVSPSGHLWTRVSSCTWELQVKLEISNSTQVEQRTSSSIPFFEVRLEISSSSSRFYT